jgi:hypothetical protein
MKSIVRLIMVGLIAGAFSMGYPLAEGWEKNQTRIDDSVTESSAIGTQSASAVIEVSVWDLIRAEAELKEQLDELYDGMISTWEEMNEAMEAYEERMIEVMTELGLVYPGEVIPELERRAEELREAIAAAETDEERAALQEELDRIETLIAELNALKADTDEKIEKHNSASDAYWDLYAKWWEAKKRLAEALPTPYGTALAESLVSRMNDPMGSGNPNVPDEDQLQPIPEMNGPVTPVPPGPEPGNGADRVVDISQGDGRDRNPRVYHLTGPGKRTNGKRQRFNEATNQEGSATTSQIMQVQQQDSTNTGIAVGFKYVPVLQKAGQFGADTARNRTLKIYTPRRTMPVIPGRSTKR